VSTGLKTVKGGKTEDEFAERKITLRGTEYTIRELDVVQYKAALKDATKEDGTTPFQDLLDLMVLRCVSPSPATRSKPMPYPVYRTLEDIVNVMHFITLRDEAAKGDDDDDGDDEENEGEGEPAPNS
jgi:hypothetical protein